MTTARQKVLAHLKKTRFASAREIARALNMSAPNVRHHLGVLVSDGRVEAASARHQGGRGRPEKVYSLSQAAMGGNLAALVDALLAEAGSQLNIESLASRMLDVSQFTNLSITKSLPLLVEKLNERRYQARWEAGAEGPRLILGRCPYLEVIDAHPELCEMETALLKKALSRRILRVEKSEAAGRGLCPFVFIVG